MGEPIFELFNMKGLVGKLNSALADPEETITLGEFITEKPIKNHFLHRLTNKKIENMGRYPLTQTVYSKGIFGFLDIDSEINLGNIFIETGFTDIDSSYVGKYETIRLRTKYPIELKNDNIVPKCSIKLLQEFYDDFTEPYQKRRDHVRKLGLIWVKDDLSDILPSEWFFSRSREVKK